MKSRRGSNHSCFCSHCLYKHNKDYSGIERTRSKIDKIFSDKYIPLREIRLIDKLERTRAVYDDIRAPFVGESESNRNITNKKPRDSSESHQCCSCCGCTTKNKISGDTAGSDISHVGKISNRRVRFKPEFIKSEPCVCLAKFSNLLKKPSEFIQSKLKRDFSEPVLKNRIKGASTKYRIKEALSQRSRVGKVLNNVHRNVVSKRQQKITQHSDSKAHLEKMLKLSVKKPSKSRHKVEDIKHTNDQYEGQRNKRELDHRLCPCPQEKLVLKIRKDSIRKFYEDLEKKRTLNHLECKSECIQDICIPKECLDKIKLSKGRKSAKKQKRRKSLKQIVSKASRKKKKSVMCQCDGTNVPIKGSIHQKSARQNKVKFVPSKKGVKVKSNLNLATLDRPKSKFDRGKTLRRCFCTLKFPSGIQNMSHKNSSKLFDYPHSGQSGDIKKSSTHIYKTRKGEKSKSSCTVSDCDPNECLKYYFNRQRQRAPYEHRLNTASQPKSEYEQDNRRALKIGSSISFNIEFYKEKVPEDTHKSIKTNTIPHLSTNSVKSSRALKNKNNKKKVIIMDNLFKKEDHIEKYMSTNIIRKIKKYTNGTRKTKADFVEEFQYNNNMENDFNNEMVDQSTKISNKDKRLLKPFKCESQTCIPGNCDPHLCLKKKRNKHKHVITDIPEMKSVASGVHKKKLKHVKAQSKSYFTRKNAISKSGLNTLEDQARILPREKQSHRNTLRLSSNFSFAIEIGKGVAPHMYPIQTNERYNSNYETKSIESRIINNDDTYHSRRTNQSKNSVINTMVKRCMCTLNLSKKQNKNKSRGHVNEKSTKNTYTVNTAMTSNIGPFLEKHRSDKKHRPSRSQFVCNYIHMFQRENIVNKELLNKLNIKRQLKNNFHRVSKSLSFLSNEELKKNSDRIPPNHVASKNITLYESSDHTEHFYFVGEHQTFRKSSKYWEKCYCTMNLMAMYNKNNKTKKRMTKQSQKNCVRVGSNIDLNIEFYKSNLCTEAKPNMIPTTPITKKDGSLRSNMTQNVISSYNKAVHYPEDQGCFCTLKLQNENSKHIEKSKQKLPSVVNFGSDVRYISRSQNTPKLKGRKIVRRKIVSEEQCEPRECTPGMCDPVRCDPASCYKILYNRKSKTRSISAATKTTKKMRAGNLTRQPSVKNAKTQSRSIKNHQESSEWAPKRKSVPFNYLESGKQCAKFGSKVSFSIEFYKENSPTSKRVHYDPVFDEKLNQLRKYTTESSTTKTKEFTHKKLSAGPHDSSLIKRCFCTLKLQKKPKKPLLTKVQSVGVMAGVKNKWYSDKVLLNQANMNKGDVQNMYNTKSAIRKNKKETISKHKKQHRTILAELLPYECEPGSCVPGTCDPYQCLQEIKARKLVKRNIGAVTTRLRKKSVGTINGTLSKHRRIQTASYPQNDMETSRLIPKKVKPVYDSSLSNDQCVRIGSNINFSIEFFKDKDCDRTLSPHETSYKDANFIKHSSYKSYNHRPMINTKAALSHITEKHQKTKYKLNKSKEPIVNFQVSSQKQSQLSQTRRKYFSKNKGLLPYECKPNVCIPGQCDPYKCYELIQRRIYKDCSAVTVANVRDFASNATPCKTCKSKRIQTGHHQKEVGGIKLMKSVLGSKSRNFIRISSNFGFHIEICKRGETNLLREVQVSEDRYKYKKAQRTLHDQASQSQYIKRRSRSSFAKSKLQRCFCTKKFFNSSAKNASRNLEYTTNCALVLNTNPKISKIYNINRNNHNQIFVNTQFHLNKQNVCNEPTKYVKNNIKHKRQPTFRRNVSKNMSENKMRSNLSFNLEIYNRTKFSKEGINKNQKKIWSDQHIYYAKQKSNVKQLEMLKTIDSKSVQGQGDSQKIVGLKKCYSTINFTKKCERNCKNQQDFVDSQYETIQQALKQKRYGIKYIFTDSNKTKKFSMPQAKIIRWDKVNESLLNSNNYVCFLCKASPTDRGPSIKNNNFIERKKYNGESEGKRNYFQNIYNKLNPYMEKMNLRRLIKNMRLRRRGDTIIETTS